jgi:hypothetical protein
VSPRWSAPGTREDAKNVVNRLIVAAQDQRARASRPMGNAPVWRVSGCADPGDGQVLTARTGAVTASL